MSQKTSQLQIRVSPEQKEILKQLAAAADMSVSAYVLAAALPRASAALKEHLGALRNVARRRQALTELRAELSRIPTAEFEAAGAGLDVRGLPPVQQNLAAAAFEQEAQIRRCAPPSWTGAVPRPESPTFGPDLGSLRPYLLCSAPAALKRRNVFVLWDERRSSGGSTPASTIARSPAAPQSESEERLTRLDEALAERGIAAELCLVGGAVMPFVFRAQPESRRPRALLGSDEDLAEASALACPELDSTWMNQAALEVARNSEARFYAGQALSVLEPPADYVLAMKCLALAWSPSPPQAAERDISYLLRFLGLSQPRTALERITAYLNSRQIPTDLDTRLPHLI